MFGAKDPVEHLDDEVCAHLDALLDVAAGVEVVVVAGHILHAPQIVGHRFGGKTTDIRISRAGVERVGRMGDDLGDVVFSCELQEGCDVTLVDGLGTATAWVTGEELEGVGADRYGGFAHGEEAFGGREVTTDSKHDYKS